MRSRAGIFAERGAATAWIAALAILAPGDALAAESPAPDAASLTSMRESVARSSVLRVRGDFGVRRFRGARLDSSGVRNALFGSAEAQPSPESDVIPWSAISTLETQRPKKLQGAIGGLVVGLAIGVTLALNHESRNTEDFTAVGLLIGPPFYGLIGGTIIGSLRGKKVIYRSPTREKP